MHIFVFYDCGQILKIYTRAIDRDVITLLAKESAGIFFK